jgi:outer membrane protein TolC
VRELNKDILTKRAEKGIAATAIDRAAAAFQPVASVTATDGRNRQPSTYEERLSRPGAVDSFYQRAGQDVTAGVSQLLPTGAKLEAKSSLSRLAHSAVATGFVIEESVLPGTWPGSSIRGVLKRVR